MDLFLRILSGLFGAIGVVLALPGLLLIAVADFIEGERTMRFLDEEFDA